MKILVFTGKDSLFGTDGDMRLSGYDAAYARWLMGDWSGGSTQFQVKIRRKFSSSVFCINYNMSTLILYVSFSCYVNFLG